MKAPPRACYNFVTLVQGYDKLDGPWRRVLVDRARRATTNVVWAARRAGRAAVLHSISRRAPPSARFRCTLNGFRCWTPSSAGLILRACAVAGATHAWLTQTRLMGLGCGYWPCAALRRRRGCRGVAGEDGATSPLLLMAMMESV